MVELKHVSAGYAEHNVLHDINLRIEPGKLMIIAGPNGCGKSTLLKTIVRLLPHSDGTITVNDKPLQAYRTSELAQHIAYLPQKRNVPDITVERMVMHGRFPYLKYPRRYRKIDYEMVKTSMAMCGIEDLSQSSMHALSGGMQQKAYIAMALAQDTPVILLDEPTVYLDIDHQLKVMELAKQLAEQGKAVVLVLHDLLQAFQYGDQIVLMQDGQIKACASPKELEDSPLIEALFHVKLKAMESIHGKQYYYVTASQEK